ncbi:MAG: tRNA pseudouridine(38-40) synthase TruA, partial [Candidatus Omnitrophica bacterium]|nr:tRNA pseudouridine(38-40) synthase TruA [Candidatus Omnitrophota bacterium]
MSRRSSTRNIKLVIMYDGTHYSGWQSQKNAGTVQMCIESALRKITGRKVKLTGAGRTDSGVHAIGQVANFKTHSKLDLNKLKDALNSHLSGEILIVSAEYVPLKF